MSNTWTKYAKHIAQKYKTAIAIAVLQNKPTDASIEHYIEKLRNNIQPENMEIDDIDLTVCSDDFNVDNDFPSLTKDLDTDAAIAEDCGDSQSILRNNGTDQILKVDDNVINEITSQRETLDLLKEINKADRDKLESQLTDFNSDLIPEDNILNDVCNSVDNATVIDTQLTELYEVNELLDQNLTHVSETQVSENDGRFEILERYVLGINKRKHCEVDASNKKQLLIEDVEELRNNEENIADFDTIISEDILSSNDKRKMTDVGSTFCETAEYDDNTDDSKNMSHKRFKTQHERYHNEFENVKTPVFRELEEVVKSNEKPLIPFKIIEELNKIKVLMDARGKHAEGLSLSSGYRTDSQTSSLFSNIPINQLNQSAHCLFSYLMDGPIILATYTIIQEISKVLGEFIDKLHTEEIYPSFLEVVLEKIGNMLEDIWTGDSCGGSALALKNEHQVRLLLLNESLHIVSYTTDKIIDKLEDFHKQVTTSENLYEISNINEMENISYTFHILEILLERYLKKNSPEPSQVSQTSSSSSSFPKKSAITDVWKKKWDPNYKKDEERVVEDKICLVTKSRVVLKKIMIDCMEGYSLISFAAMQCFNYLQR